MSSGEDLRSKLRATLLSMQTDVGDVDDVIQGLEKKLESVVNRLENLEKRLRKLESLLGDAEVS